jgi:hypothetical protein
MKVLFYQMLPDFRKSIAFERFQGFARLSFWQKQRVDGKSMGH